MIQRRFLPYSKNSIFLSYGVSYDQYGKRKTLCTFKWPWILRVPQHTVSESCWQASGSNLARYFCNDQQLIGWCNWVEIVLYGMPKILRATFCIQMHTPLQHHSLTVLPFMVIEVASCFVVQCDIKHDGVLGCIIWQRKFMESSLTKFTS